MRYTKKFLIVFFVVLAVVVAADMLTKIFVYGKDCTLIDGVLSVFSTKNTGAAWSVFSGQQTFLIVITFLFLILFVVCDYFWVKQKNVLYSISVAFVFGGAIGNLIDRIAFGYVRDFIKLDFINFPVFNFADIFLCVGVGLLILYFVLCQVKLYKEKKHAKNNNG